MWTTKELTACSSAGSHQLVLQSSKFPHNTKPACTVVRLNHYTITWQKYELDLSVAHDRTTNLHTDVQSGVKLFLLSSKNLTTIFPFGLMGCALDGHLLWQQLGGNFQTGRNNFARLCTWTTALLCTATACIHLGGRHGSDSYSHVFDKRL